MKRTILIATVLAAVLTASAENLYLSSINNYNDDFLNYKCQFQYNTSDMVSQIEITQSCIDDYYHGGIMQPPHIMFNFDYEASSLIKSASYDDFDTQPVLADFNTSYTTDGKTVETTIHNGYGHKLISRYNKKDELISVERYNCLGTVEEVFNYDYTYDDEGLTTIVTMSNDSRIIGKWTFFYNDDSSLDECDYFAFNEDGSSGGVAVLFFNYYDENEIGNNLEVVTPEPYNFIYYCLNTDPLVEDTLTLYIPECAIQILRKQKGRILKRFASNTFLKTPLVTVIPLLFEFKYQSERPTAGIEDMAVDFDVAPEYYNIQGMRVANPSEGEIYIVKRGACATKEVYRH